MDEMFAEGKLRHYVDMPWMTKPYFYSSDIRRLHRAKLSPYRKRFYAKLYRLRIIEQKRFVVGGAKYTEELKIFDQLQDEYLLLVNNDIKDVSGLVKYRSEQQEKMQRIEDRQQEIYKENFSRKRRIKTDEQYREYQVWHVGVQEELDVNVTRMDESITDVTSKSGFVEPEEKEPVDKVVWIVRRISELGGYANISDTVKADVLGFDIINVSGSIRLFSDAMKRLGIKLDDDELYEEFQRIYDESVSSDAEKEKIGDKMWNRGRGK